MRGFWSFCKGIAGYIYFSGFKIGGLVFMGIDLFDSRRRSSLEREREEKVSVRLGFFSDFASCDMRRGGGGIS